MKTPVIFNRDYIVYLEQYQDYTFIHCDCFKWAKTTKNKLIKDIDTLSKLHNRNMYALHDEDDKKHYKFLTMLKFKYISNILCSDGKERQIFVRSL